MIFIGDDSVAAFVCDKIGKPIIPPYTCMGMVNDEGEITAGVVFNDYERTDIHVTVAGSGWTRGFIAEVGRYVYSTLGCERITVITEQPSVVQLAQRMGGEIEGVLRNHFGRDRDGYLVGILKEDWRFKL